MSIIIKGPASTVQTTTNARTLHHCRRRARQRENIWSLLSTLPEPYGLNAPAFYRELPTWAETSEQLSCPVQWQTIPAPCEPCAFLSSDISRRIKQAKSVKSVLQTLGLEISDPMLMPVEPMASDTRQLDRRGVHKRWQVESFVLVLRRLIESDLTRQWHIVDFGCGTGGLILPLACLFPTCKFTGVEMNPAALAIMRQRVTTAGLTNVDACVGMIEGFERSFDIALALHACGNATDMALLKAEQQRAAYIVSPCCVGKLKFSLQGGTSFSSVNTSWRWNPRMKGSNRDQIREAGESLLAAAQGLTPSHLQKSEGMASGTSMTNPVPLETTQVIHKEGGQSSIIEDGSYQKDTPVLRHPRSTAFNSLLPEAETQYKLLAQVADTVYIPEKQQRQMADEQQGSSFVHSVALSEALSSISLISSSKIDEGNTIQSEDSKNEFNMNESQGNTSDDAKDDDLARKAAYCALAKLHVELDRNEAAREAGYAVGIFRMLNAGSMAKGDLLVGLPAESKEWAHVMHLLEGPSATR